jgi:hypothetical protein
LVLAFSAGRPVLSSKIQVRPGRTKIKSLSMTSEKLYTLFLVIPAILIYSILLYLHVSLYVVLPKKLGGVKTIFYFIYFVGFWITLINL